MAGKNIADFVSECRGKESRRVGLYHLERVCLVDAEIPCSARYQWGYGKKVLGSSFYCSYRESKPQPFRKELYSGQILNDREDLLVLRQAQKLLEKLGINDHVLELSQPTVIGGVTYRVTSYPELDKEYIGYRGYMTYELICKHIEELQRRIKK